MEVSQEETLHFLQTAKAYTSHYLGNEGKRNDSQNKEPSSKYPSHRPSRGSPWPQDPEEVVEQLTDTKIKQITTHSAHIFLVNDKLAFKLERAVHYPFMDLSTLSLRKDAIWKELCLNRRTSPEIYLGLVAVCQSHSGQLYLVPISESHASSTVTLTQHQNREMVGQHQLEIVDYLVEMRQFKQENLLDNIARKSQLTHDVIEKVIDQMVLFHNQARVFHGEEYGSQAMLWVANDNFKELCDFGKEGKIDSQKAANTCRACVLETQKVKDLMDLRLAQNKIRFCHGDLHLKNIVLLGENDPRLFDCIEFNDKLAISDVMYDLAFLIMDLLHRNLKPFACICLNRYIQKTHDLDGLQLLPIFIANRAIIRAKVACAEMSTHQDEQEILKHLKLRAESYLTLAQSTLDQLISSTRKSCVAIGGFSGSGKSAVARLLACSMDGVIGAIVLRSDVIRKYMWGADLLDRLPDDVYTLENRQKCYEKMKQLTEKIREFGYPVVLDATFTTDSQRAILDAIPCCKHARFEVRLERLIARKQDASDMTSKKLASQEGSLPLKEQWKYINAEQTIEAVVADVVAETICSNNDIN